MRLFFGSVQGRGWDSDCAGTRAFSHPWENATRPTFAPALPGLRESWDAPPNHRPTPSPSEPLLEWHRPYRDNSIGTNRLGDRPARASSSRQTSAAQTSTPTTQRTASPRRSNQPELRRRGGRMCGGASQLLRSAGGAGAKVGRVAISHGWEIARDPATYLPAPPPPPSINPAPKPVPNA